MASSGSKKSKKNKGKVIPLQSFLSTNDTPSGTAQVTKKIRNYDGDDSDDSGAVIPLVYQLPTAPRANRIFNDTSIPHTPPFIAYITNLPFDFTEDDLYEYFEAYNLVSVRLPRDENDTSSRSRGSASVELESRDDLIEVLSLPDPYIKGRRVRIDATNEQDHYGKSSGGHRGVGGGHHRRGFDNFGSGNHNSDNRESSSSSNWRDNNNKSQDNYSRDNYNRDNRERNISRDTNSPGSWRKGDRPSATHFSYHNRDNRDNNRERDNNSSSSYKQSDDKLQERPKLNLKPRTLPLPEIVTKPLDIENDVPSTTDGGVGSGSGNGSSSGVGGTSGNIGNSGNSISSGSGSGNSSMSGYGVSAEKVFGDAKPVDTTARDLEIEERLAESRRQEQQALLQQSQEDENNDVTQNMRELNMEKVGGKESKENFNNPQTNWRIKSDITTEKYFDKNGDNKRRGGDFHYRDSNRYNRDRERSERSQNHNRSNNKDHSTDGKHKYERKRLDNNNKTNRAVTKNISSSQQQETKIKSSNMYSGLDDGASD